MRPDDKLSLVTRADLPPGAQAVQAAHALQLFNIENPEVARAWHKESNYLALLAVPTEADLARLYTKAERRGIPVSAFREPDLGDSLTAIALAPSPGARSLTRAIPLALSA
jgi:peptidyl-tRNA hydrolase